MFDLFKIGFVTVTFVDLLDVIIVAFIIYRLYMLLKGTIAAQIFIGLMIILVLSFVSQAINLRALSWLLNLITGIWVIAFLILFQPEIRRLLVIVARNPVFKMFVKQDTPDTASIITDAAFELSQHQHGALIILIRSTGIRGFTETGEILNARLNKPLLTSIFFPRSPLHDGAVIIKNNVIEAARCTLPLSSTTTVNGESLGMRHRAGLGISEQADVISVIVSEETGAISVAEDGKLVMGLSKDVLRQKLAKASGPQPAKGWRNIIEQYLKEK
jgi:diadenylate cyclase